MPQRLNALSTARREHRGRSTAPSGPSKAAPSQGYGNQSRTTAGAAPEQSPEIEGVLELQRTVGNRAVMSAAAAGNLPNLIAIQRRGGALQREAAKAPAADSSEKAQADANAIVAGLRSAMTAAQSKMGHLPPQQADLYISLIGVYLQVHPGWEFQLFAEPAGLWELLAPWGFTGRDVQLDADGRLRDKFALRSLESAIKKWRGQDARARKKARAATQSSMGTYVRQPKLAEMELDDNQVVAGPNRADPSDPWGPDYTGTRKARRAERERLKNEHAMGMIEGITNAGPGALAGLVAGRLAAAVLGTDPQKTQELGMAVGGLADAFIMTGAALAPGEAGGGGMHDEQGEMFDPKGEGTKAGESANAAPLRGTGVTGPRAQSGPRGGGAYNTLGVGPVRTESPKAVVELFKGDAHMVRHSARQEWHQEVFEEALIETGQWNPSKGNAPRAPLAFRMKGGMIQVNDEAWVKQGHSIKDIIRPSQVGSGSLGGAKTLPGEGIGTAGTVAGGIGTADTVAGGIGTADTLPGGAGGAGGRAGTKVGHAGGPGGAAAAEEAAGAPKPGPSGTRLGHAKAPFARPSMKWDPKRPSPNPPGDTVRAATFEEVKRAFEADPSSVVVGGDGPSPDHAIPDMHQYIWEYRRWVDGRPTKDAAPAAFYTVKGRIRVDPTKWREAGHDPMELIEKSQPAPDSMKEQMGHAKTLPASGGPNVTMAGDD